MNRTVKRVGVAVVVTAFAASASVAQAAPEVGGTFHEQEVGWASRQLAEVFGVPVGEGAFSRAVSELGKRASFGEPVTEDDVSKLMTLYAAGVDPGATTRAWIGRMDLDGKSIQDDPKAGIIGVGSINCIILPIADWLRENPNAEGLRRATFRKALLIMLAETDFLTPGGVLNELRKPESVNELQLDDASTKRLAEFKVRLEARNRATGQALGRLVHVIQAGRRERRPPTESEQRDLISLIDSVRQIGTTSQGDWRILILNCHAVLRLSGVPAERRVDTPFAEYLRAWEAELPDGNVKRWLRQAITAGPDLEPVQFDDGTQLRPAAPR